MTQLLKFGLGTAKAEAESLFSGVLIRWDALNLAERVVCTLIVLIPLWWVLGIIPYLPDFITLGVVIYEWQHYKKLRLLRPSFVAIALFAYFAYGCLDSVLLFFDAHPLAKLPPDAVKKPIDLLQSIFAVFSMPFLVCYIQSHNIRVRLSVVAWASSVSVIQSLGLWLYVHFVLHEAFYTPQRTVWAILTGKSAEFYRGIGNSNYLAMYWPDDKAFGGVARFYSFFHHAENFGLFVGVVGVIALDIKNHIWSVLLFGACVFLIGLSGTRSVWIAFPVAVVVRSWFVTGKVAGYWLPFALTAIISFTSLSVPPVTDLFLNTSNNTATYISNFRSNSTKDREDIYERTIDGILDNPVNFLFGHKLMDDGAGSHSFILGSLYLGGLIGTLLFVAFWTSLVRWLYRTRRGRPMCCFFILLLLSLIFATMLLTPVAIMSILLCTILGQPTMNLKRDTPGCVNL